MVMKDRIRQLFARGLWARGLNTALGIWLMAAPSVLEVLGTPVEKNDRIVGPIVATFAIIAIWGATRPVRRINTLAGLWLLAAPWVLGYEAGAAIANDMIVGLFVIGLSLVKGEMVERFGHGWSTLWPPFSARGEQQREIYGVYGRQGR